MSLYVMGQFVTYAFTAESGWIVLNILLNLLNLMSKKNNPIVRAA